MNRMAEQLHDRLATVEKQRNEMEAVLSSMVEGVLAIDTDETVLGLNRAGARLLGLDPERTLGRSIQEVVRNPDLLALAQDALEGADSVEGDIVLSRESESYLQVHATGLQGAKGERLGALLVLNDVTRLRRLESMRRITYRRSARHGGFSSAHGCSPKPSRYSTPKRGSRVTHATRPPCSS